MKQVTLALALLSPNLSSTHWKLDSCAQGEVREAAAAAASAATAARTARVVQAMQKEWEAERKVLEEEAVDSIRFLLVILRGLLVISKGCRSD